LGVRVATTRAANVQKFFGSFFKKRTAFLRSLSPKWMHREPEKNQNKCVENEAK
jgi:hypothetical protein